MNYLKLVLAGILSGGIVFGGKLLALCGATPFEVMLFPSLIGTLVVTPFIWDDFCKFVKFPWRITSLFVFSVFIITVGEYVPLFMDISVTLVLLLVYLQPVWTILIEHFFLKVEIPGYAKLTVGLMLIGMIILINPFSGIHYNFIGVSLALLAGVGESIWIIVTKYFSEHNIRPASTYWCTCAYVLVPLALLYFGLNDYMERNSEPVLAFTFDISSHLWVGFIIYSLLIYTPANLLIFSGNKGIPAGVIGMIMLLEPVTGITLDVIFLHNPLTWNIIVGGVIILASNIYLITKNNGSLHQQKAVGTKRV